ncbi:MAG: MobV family relaxase, partial [Clostridia bacterium]|nr:MobV family relaxase [Clostridia bacterium]
MDPLDEEKTSGSHRLCRPDFSPSSTTGKPFGFPPPHRINPGPNPDSFLTADYKTTRDMGQYIVLHMEKRREISPVLERHIFRLEIRYVDGVRTEAVWTPDNADPEKANLNEELVSMKSETPEGKEITLTINQAIRKRLNEAGIKKVRKDQNTAIEIILTGSPETMNNLSEEDLKKWVEESMKWAGKQWGKDNIVSAVLHRDEKTPHIHIILVPLVTGQSRRTASKEKKLAQQGITKKNYNVNNERLRLSANEVYTQPRLYGYHTSYAKEVGEKYGLQRGVQAEVGSKKKHQTSEEYNRQLERERREQQELIDTLKSDYSEKEKNLEQINADIEIAQDALNIAGQERITAEARKDQAEIDAATKEAQVKELETKITELDATLDEKGHEVSEEFSLKEALDTYNEQLTTENKELQTKITENNTKISEQQTTIDTNSEKISTQEDDLAHYKKQLDNYKNAIQVRKNELQSLSSFSLLKLVEKIPEMIRYEIQSKISKYWKGTVQSYERVQYAVENEEGQRDFVKIKMRNEDHDYFIEVREDTGDVFFNGSSEIYKRKFGEEMNMPELASFFNQELLPSAKEAVSAMYKKVEPKPAEAVEQGDRVVWECDLGMDKCRIVEKPDGICHLEREEW